MKTSLAAAVAALALSGSFALAQDGMDSEQRPSAGGTMSEASQGTLKTIKCDAPCDFEVRGRDEDEVISAVKKHAQDKHQKTMTDQEIRARMQTGPAGMETQR